MAYTKKIEIQHFTEMEDTVGNHVQSWETFFCPWAEINTATAKEYYAAAQVNSENDVVFKIRYSSILVGKLTSEVRIVYKGLIYDVKRIEDINEQHRQFAIRAVQLNGGVRNERNNNT